MLRRRYSTIHEHERMLQPWKKKVFRSGEADESADRLRSRAAQTAITQSSVEHGHPGLQDALRAAWRPAHLGLFFRRLTRTRFGARIRDREAFSRPLAGMRSAIYPAELIR
jgi:hypothetical protein